MISCVGILLTNVADLRLRALLRLAAQAKWEGPQDRTAAQAGCRVRVRSRLREQAHPNGFAMSGVHALTDCISQRAQIDGVAGVGCVIFIMR
jgi:hypothetical protein